MNDWAKDLFNRYRHKGLLVDTNILLLYFVGLTNRDRISRFKRTRQFGAEDFDLLSQILEKRFSQIVTTPNVLTEVNSFINQLGEPEREQCLEFFARAMVNLYELYLESEELVKSTEFSRFGLTDCGILELPVGQYLILTDDLRLTDSLQKRGVDVVNFNHLRPLGWS
ncbi:PIN domain-containing protein [Synechococcus sp. PCC 7336]|uniref:PIN domain-containing protein n=1 Tax=Synechococcus sp. PCC 7336 TaxID=195250 RepID=UPI0003467B2E|nr:PIN domain-containing protein [Synechococcus sp. PCC 7336]